MIRARGQGRKIETFDLSRLHKLGCLRAFGNARTAYRFNRVGSTPDCLLLDASLSQLSRFNDRLGALLLACRDCASILPTALQFEAEYFFRMRAVLPNRVVDDVALLCAHYTIGKYAVVLENCARSLPLYDLGLLTIREWLCLLSGNGAIGLPLIIPSKCGDFWIRERELIAYDGEPILRYELNAYLDVDYVHDAPLLRVIEGSRVLVWRTMIFDVEGLVNAEIYREHVIQLINVAYDFFSNRRKSLPSEIDVTFKIWQAKFEFYFLSTFTEERVIIELRGPFNIKRIIPMSALFIMLDIFRCAFGVMEMRHLCDKHLISEKYVYDLMSRDPNGPD